MTDDGATDGSVALMLLAALIDNIENRGGDVLGPLDTYLVEFASRADADPRFRNALKPARALLQGMKERRNAS